MLTREHDSENVSNAKHNAYSRLWKVSAIITIKIKIK